MKHFITSVWLVLVIFSAAALAAPDSAGLPPGEKDAKARLEKSPRHGEWIDISVPGSQTPLKSYIVYPEVKEKAPVVIVIHEIFGETDWIRSVADQLAADGFIAIAPDLLSGHGAKGGGTDSFAGGDDVKKAIRDLKPDEVTAGLNAVFAYGKTRPASSGKTATIGFCWGGGQSFAYAAHQPELSAAVVYYGQPPAPADLAKINAPVLGNYGGIDARITITVEPTVAEMKKLDKVYLPHIYDGAGHGFLRGQDLQNGANLKAAQEAWPLTIAFLREHTK